MERLNKNSKISIYGSINIKDLKRHKEENIPIVIENKKVGKIGDFLYDILDKKYKKYNYDWDNISKKITTTEIIINGKSIKNCNLVNIFGYVENYCGLPTENGKKYSFWIKDIFMSEIFSELEILYDNYICDFDTIREGLKFVVTKLEIQ